MGDVVMELRALLKLTQRDFARLLGVSGPTVARWETNALEVNGTCQRLLKLLSYRNLTCLTAESALRLLEVDGDDAGCKAFLRLIEDCPNRKSNGKRS